MRVAFIVLASLLVPFAAPGASASHECGWYEAKALGIEVDACLDERGRPHHVIVKDKSLGGAMLSHPLFSGGHHWLGGDFQGTNAVVWTYSGTPTGRTWVAPMVWCTDTDGDGFCDFMWVGSSTYARGLFNQVDVSRFPNGEWRACTLLATGWSCHTLPISAPGAPLLPTLP